MARSAVLCVFLLLCQLLAPGAPAQPVPSGAEFPSQPAAVRELRANFDLPAEQLRLRALRLREQQADPVAQAWATLALIEFENELEHEPEVFALLEELNASSLALKVPDLRFAALELGAVVYMHRNRVEQSGAALDEMQLMVNKAPNRQWQDGQGGTTVVKNCTMHANRIGLFGHGSNFTAHNTLITGSDEGATETTGGVTLRYCNLFDNVANYVGMPSQTGTNGNISADPQYRNEEQDDFRLNFGSASIDAADGAQAPLTDRSGAPRYDDPRTANTGAGSPVFVDIGAYELVEGENVASNLDLAVSNVAGPGSALAGDTVTVTWTIRNAGTETIVGPWFDAVALREAGGASPPQFVVEFETGIGMVLGPGQTFAASGQVRVPGGAPGRYEWQVLTNSHGTVFEGQNGGNNLAIAATAFDLDLKEVVFGAPARNELFGGVDPPHIRFKISRITKNAVFRKAVSCR